MPRSYTNLIYHIVFSTKDRRPFITPERRDRLYEYLGGTIRGLGGISLGINGVEDHVHLLAKLRPDKSVSDVLRDLKSNASGWMHDVFPDAGDFSWQNGYGAFSVGPSEIERIRKYIADQEIHHRTQSFEEEFVELTNKWRTKIFLDKFISLSQIFFNPLPKSSANAFRLLLPEASIVAYSLASLRA